MTSNLVPDSSSSTVSSSFFDMPTTKLYIVLGCIGALVLVALVQAGCTVYRASGKRTASRHKVTSLWEPRPSPQEMRKYRRLHVRRRVCRRRVAMLLYFFCGKRKKKWRIKHSGFWDNFRGCTVCNWTRPTSTNPTGVRPLNAPPILTGPFGNLVGECGSRFNPSGVSFKPPMGVAYVNYGHPHWLRRFQTRQNITHAHCTT